MRYWFTKPGYCESSIVVMLKNEQRLLVSTNRKKAHFAIPIRATKCAHKHVHIKLLIRIRLLQY